MKVVHTTHIGDSPAAIDRSRGILYLNPDIMRTLTPFQQKFVYWHEMGHYHLDTSDEIQADAYAFDQLAGTEFQSLKQCLKSLREVLSEDNPTLKPRYDALLIRAFEWDAQRGSQTAKKALEAYYAENTNAFLGNLFESRGRRAKREAQAEYTRAQAKALLKQTFYAGETLLRQQDTQVTMAVIIAVVLLIYFM